MSGVVSTEQSSVGVDHSVGQRFSNLRPVRHFGSSGGVSHESHLALPRARWMSSSGREYSQYWPDRPYGHAASSSPSGSNIAEEGAFEALSVAIAKQVADLEVISRIRAVIASRKNAGDKITEIEDIILENRLR